MSSAIRVVRGLRLLLCLNIPTAWRVGMRVERVGLMAVLLGKPYLWFSSEFLLGHSARKAWACEAVAHVLDSSQSGEGQMSEYCVTL